MSAKSQTRLVIIRLRAAPRVALETCATWQEPREAVVPQGCNTAQWAEGISVRGPPSLRDLADDFGNLRLWVQKRSRPPPRPRTLHPKRLFFRLHRRVDCAYSR